MKTVQKFTTTIAPDLLSWLNTYAHKTSKTRREILEESIRKYKEDTIRENMRQDFIRASKDGEMIEMAEWGMGDYTEIIKSND